MIRTLQTLPVPLTACLGDKTSSVQVTPESAKDRVGQWVMLQGTNPVEMDVVVLFTVSHPRSGRKIRMFRLPSTS